MHVFGGSYRIDRTVSSWYLVWEFFVFKTFCDLKIKLKLKWTYYSLDFKSHEFLGKNRTYKKSSSLSVSWDSDQEYLPDKHSLLAVSRNILEEEFEKLCFVVTCYVCMYVCILISSVKSVELRELELVSPRGNLNLCSIIFSV